jgi:hypothetical protein
MGSAAAAPPVPFGFGSVFGETVLLGACRGLGAVVLGPGRFAASVETIDVFTFFLADEGPLAQPRRVIDNHRG